MKKNVTVILSVAALAVGGVVVYNLPYFKEKRAYNEAVEDNCIAAYDYYLDSYPDGAHAQIAMMHKLDIAYSPLDKINYAQEYLEKFPGGDYSELVNARIDSIWDSEISRYKDLVVGRGNSQATAYMTEMFEYMKKNRINTLVVDVDPTINLRDYREFDADVRSLLEIFNDSGLSYDTDMISLKSNFSQGAVDDLTDILVGGVKRNFDALFSEGIINVEPDGHSSLSVDAPKITFDYTISNQVEMVENYEFPEIWVYSSGDTPKKLMLGIDVEFDARFSIPGSDKTFNFREKGDPGSEISDVEDFRDCYRRMTQACFHRFSNKISSLTGFE